jgi:hypothetical protein
VKPARAVLLLVWVALLTGWALAFAGEASNARRAWLLAVAILAAPLALWAIDRARRR